VARLGLKPENGVEVIATGRLTNYADRSQYQLVVDRLEYAGVGALLARIDRLRQLLQAEGLFAADRKRVLPQLPRLIGVVTSPTGAVIQDIQTTIARRFPRDILLWPVPVQGEGAAARIAAAIAGFDRLTGDLRPDVLIVARGGGSLEDLMAFNDEAVVRAVAACVIPIVSAVGHETDTTLIDHVSDRRAPTPTAAAELVVPVRIELLAAVGQRGARLDGGLGRLMADARLQLGRAERGLPDPGAVIGSARQRLDDRTERLSLALPSLVATRRAELVGVERRLPVAADIIAIRRAALAQSSDRLPRSLMSAVGRIRSDATMVLARLNASPLMALLRHGRSDLRGSMIHLEAVSPLSVLARGYALVTDRSGQPLTRAAEIAPGAALRLRFADGEVAVSADPAKTGPSRQGQLKF
jgi:exodeoxyribonuclease VII large subunit